MAQDITKYANRAVLDVHAVLAVHVYHAMPFKSLMSLISFMAMRAGAGI